MQFDILTIFPHILDSYVKESIIKRSSEKDQIAIKFWDLRDYTTDKHHSLDDAPYGGGPGMILQIQPIFRCLEDILGCQRIETRVRKSKTQNNPSSLPKLPPSLNRPASQVGLERASKTTTPNFKIVLLSPKGEQFSQAKAEELSKLNQLILICGRYEGVDARVEKLIDEQITIGHYVLSGGELAAMVVIETITRLLPGVLGSSDSLCVESYHIDDEKDEKMTKNKKNGHKNISRHLVEHPQYTRPKIFEPIPGIKWSVPKILLSGDHQKIKEWRKRQMR